MNNHHKITLGPLRIRPLSFFVDFALSIAHSNTVPLTTSASFFCSCVLLHVLISSDIRYRRVLSMRTFQVGKMLAKTASISE